MNGLQDLILIDEIVLQSKIAQRAAERLKATNVKFDQVETWCSIQSILVSVGNVSKILWPQKKYKIRGERLRHWLKVANSNPLSSRKFRNYFEHYDEHVEKYFEYNGKSVYIDLAMNPSLRNEIFDDAPLNTHRGYNSFNNTIVFRDETLDLNEIFVALDGIVNACKPYSLLANSTR